MAEFLLALIAIWTLWSQVGGQGHLDLMPWYDKLVLSVALALVTVLGTISATEHERAWNARTLVFLLIAFLIAAAMGVLTYYYHLHEDDEDGEGDSNVAAITPLPYGRGSVSRWETDQQPLLHLHEDDEDGEGDSNVATITPLPYGRGSVSRWETDQQPRHSAVAVTHRAVTKGSGQRPVEPRA